MKNKSSKDLFKLLVPHGKLNTNLLKILPQPDGEDYHGPTRIALQESFEKLPKPDGNFVKDFQTTGFDARIWELYLNETFRSLGLNVDQPYDRPDFQLANDEGEIVWVEAVTANASQVFDKDRGAKAPLWQEQDEIAIKLGGPLTDKLKKKYWERPWVTGKPLVLAIADFHDTGPGLRNSVHALERYAYGINARLLSAVGEEVKYVQEEIAGHLGRKTIPSGFFNLPDAENISALLFSNAGTLAKLSRMGFLRNPVRGMIIARYGTEYDDDPRAIMPAAFSYFVDEEPEGWNDEAVILHNPSAKHPLPHDFFGSTPHTVFVDGNIHFFCSGGFIYASVTEKRLCPPETQELHKEVFALEREAWLQYMDQARSEMEQRVVDAHRDLPLPSASSFP